MRRHLIVRHTTEYQYSEPVVFGRHRMMFRPRDSHTLRLLSTSLAITPKPVRITWMYDVFGNSVAYAEFGDQRASSLRFVSEISILHYEVNQPTALLMPSAEQYPFSYRADEIPDIEPLMILNRPDEEGRLAGWAKHIADRSGGRTLAILSDMMETIKREFRYQRRPSGTQDPVQTLNCDRQLPGFCAAHDRGASIPRFRGTLRQRVHLQPGPRETSRRWRHPRVGSSLLAGMRLARNRPDQRNFRKP